MRALLLFVVGVVAATAAYAGEPTRAHGGPYDGLLIDMQQMRVVGPSLAEASPVPADKAAVINTLVAALSAPNVAALKAFGPPTSAFCVNQQGQPCEAAEDVRRLPFHSNCRINTPYFLNSYGGTGTVWEGAVRLEWVCGDRLTFIAYAKVEGGKLTSLVPWTAVAPPVLVTPHG